LFQDNDTSDAAALITERHVMPRHTPVLTAQPLLSAPKERDQVLASPAT
jgi:hypothetical protein